MTNSKKLNALVNDLYKTEAGKLKIAAVYRTVINNKMITHPIRRTFEMSDHLPFYHYDAEVICTADNKDGFKVYSPLKATQPYLGLIDIEVDVKFVKKDPVLLVSDIENGISKKEEILFTKMLKASTKKQMIWSAEDLKRSLKFALTDFDDPREFLYANTKTVKKYFNKKVYGNVTIVILDSIPDNQFYEVIEDSLFFNNKHNIDLVPGGKGFIAYEQVAFGFKTSAVSKSIIKGTK